MTSIGEMLVEQLEKRGVDIVFGIPGVHTVELYRGLAASSIRHVTARHEQGVGFMADGYARVSGKPGIAFVITGPGLTNTLTPMAQARADSVPMLVISGVNDRATLGRGFGHLHELPEQQKMAATIALSSIQVISDEELIPALDQAYDLLTGHRGGPVHIEIPTDVMNLPLNLPIPSEANDMNPAKDKGDIIGVAKILTLSKSPVILAGGGARWAESALQKLAERLDAPVVQTVNARGLMHGHPLCVPASPSLEAVRGLIRNADTILAIGTELGPTDYDMYKNHNTPELSNLIRIDICPDQLARHPSILSIRGRSEGVLPEVLLELGSDRAHNSGAKRSQKTRLSALDEIGEDMRSQLELVETIRDTIPNAIMVGDSTQPIYAGNLYYDHDRAGGWFNAATGFGALGYGIPAAIGAALADPSASVICLTGDGGAQFTLSEIMVAVDEKLPVLFIIWNNHGYQEIETSMAAAGVTVVGCDPTPPNFEYVARSCGIPYRKCAMTKEGLSEALLQAHPLYGPKMIEIEYNDTH